MTCDALNRQKQTACLIREKQADYVLALKENHPLLHQEVRDYFACGQERPGGLMRSCDFHAHTQEWEHGRHEVRRCFAVQVNALDWPQTMQQWPGLQSLVMVESKRKSTGTEVHQRFYLSSLPCEATGLLEAVRLQWGVENQVHWCLDVAFDEDGCRVRKDNAAQNLALWRRLCLNFLRQEEGDKRGLEAKRLRAAWNTGYLLTLLLADKF